MNFLVDLLSFVAIIVAIVVLISLGYSIFCGALSVHEKRKVEKELIKNAKKEYKLYVEKVFEKALKDNDLEGK